jgi:mono/diheme cytochrome c family protein
MKARPKLNAQSALLSIAGAVILLAGCGSSTGPNAAAAAKGRQRYLATCALCHGDAGEGKARLGKTLQDNSFVEGLSDEELVEFLKEGRPAWDPSNERGIDMPPKGGDPTLTDDSLMEIVAYLRTL